MALLTGCEIFSSPQNTFAPEGDVASKQKFLFLLVTVFATIIGIGVGAAMLYILFRFRQRRPDEAPPKQLHGNQRFELAWTILPALLMIGLAFPTVNGILDLGRDPKPDALKVTAHASQWLWRFEYPDYNDASGKPLIVQNELHIPVDREIGITLESSDVIHSFWAPKLAGKLDVIPGRSNRMWFNATELGTFDGQCAEFCGLGHAEMRFQVVAESEQDFQAWIQEQLSAANARSASP